MWQINGKLFVYYLLPPCYPFVTPGFHAGNASVGFSLLSEGKWGKSRIFAETKLTIMRRIGHICCLLLFLCGCGERHFISDAGYRKTVEADFQRKKALFGDKAGELYAVFDEPMTTEEREALTFLFAYSTLSDIAHWGGDYLLENVRLALRAREEMPWGGTVPEDVFRHFVLPPRGNNEALDSARRVFYGALKERVARCGSMEEAALEVNHWCHEHVIYKPTNARTASPLATMRATYGRCGEESIFTLAALRAVGIPARQIYTPRWAHCDDNHAWIEVWVNGEWKYLGACEPEPRLNLAWFTSPVQQAMYVVADVFGKYRGDEELVATDSDNSIVNVTSHYTPATRAVVRVVDASGRPAAGAKVDFRIFNYGEFYPVASLRADSSGEAALTLGRGDILVWAWKDGRFGYAPFRVAERDTLTVALRHEEGDMGGEFAAVFAPPVLRPMPAEVTAAERAANDLRLSREDSIREAYIATFPSAEGESAHCGGDDARWLRFAAAARGNHAEVERFMAATPGELRPLALELLSAVPEKDLQDTPAEVWEAHLRDALPFRDRPLFRECILNPRVANEAPTAYRAPLRAWLEAEGVTTVEALVGRVRELRSPDSLYIARCLIPPTGVARSGVADSRLRDVFFVAACRSMGVAARLDPVTSAPEYFADGAWRAVSFTEERVADEGSLMVTYGGKPVADPKYFLHFTVAKLEEDNFRTIDLGSNAAVDMGAGASYSRIFATPVALEEGRYLLFTGNRHSSGAVYTRCVPFEIEAGRVTTVRMEIPECPEARRVLGRVTLPAALKGLPEDGYALLAVVDAGTEPTNHFLRDMAASAADFEAEGAPLRFFFKDGSKFRPSDFRPFPSTLAFEAEGGQALAARLAEELELVNPDNLPLVLVVNGRGEVVFLSQGYSIGLGAQVLKQLK